MKVGKTLGRNKNTDKIPNAAEVRERSFLQKTPDGDIMILKIEGIDPATGYSRVMQNLSSEFA